MISLIGKGKITDLQGNILTPSQQSVQNWTPAGSGSVDLSYVNGVNHAEFDTTGGVDLFSRKINQYLGTSVSVNSTMYQNLCTDYNYNADHRNWKLVIAQQNNAVKFWLGANNSKDSTNTYVSGQQYIYTYNSTYTDVNTRSITLTNEEAMFFNNYNDFCQFFMIGITFSKNYTLSFKSSDATVPTYQEMLAWSGINSAYMSENSYNIFISDCNTEFGEGNWTVCAFAGNYGSTMEPLKIYAYDVNLHMEPLFDGTYSNRDYRVALFPNGVQQTYQTYLVRYSYRYVDGAKYGNQPYAYLDTVNGGIKKWKNWGASSKNYLLTLSTRSTTGFTKDTSKHDITLTNGNNTYTLEVNPTASQEYQQQNILFTPTSASCSLKLDLSGMQGSGIEIDVKDIGVYEIGGEE